MCDVTLAALALTAAGSAASYESSQKQASARKKATLQGIESEAAIQKKSNDRSDAYVQENYDPNKRLVNYQAAADKREGTFDDLLSSQAADGTGEITPATAGAVSDTYTRAKAQATADTTGRAHTLARLLARQGAGADLAGREALAGADYSSDMLGFGVDSRLAQNRARVAYDAAGSKGGDLALLGGLLSGAGQAGMSYAGTRTPSGSSSLWAQQNSPGTRGW